MGNGSSGPSKNPTKPVNPAEAPRKMVESLSLKEMLSRSERLNWIPLGLDEAVVPAPRNSQGACAHGQYLFIFGGRSPEGRLNDLWRFDCESRSWLCLEPSDGPNSPVIRSGSLLVHDGMHHLYVGFGYDKNPVPHNEMYRYNLLERQWEGPLACKGRLPPARINFRSWFYDHSVWLYGGSPDGTACFGDLWRLDTRNLMWTEVCTTGPRPPPCQWCSCEMWKGPVVVLFGGHYDDGSPARTFHLLNCDTGEWTALIGDEPPKFAGQEPLRVTEEVTERRIVRRVPQEGEEQDGNEEEEDMEARRARLREFERRIRILRVRRVNHQAGGGGGGDAAEDEELNQLDDEELEHLYEYLMNAGGEDFEARRRRLVHAIVGEGDEPREMDLDDDDDDDIPVNNNNNNEQQQQLMEEVNNDEEDDLHLDNDADDALGEDGSRISWDTVLCSSPASAVYGDSLVLWGGWDGLEHRADMWAVHLRTGEWRRVRPNARHAPSPDPRGSTSAIVWDDTLYLYGGWNGWCQTSQMDAVSFKVPSLQRLCLLVIANNPKMFEGLDLSHLMFNSVLET